MVALSHLLHTLHSVSQEETSFPGADKYDQNLQQFKWVSGSHYQTTRPCFSGIVSEELSDAEQPSNRANELLAAPEIAVPVFQLPFLCQTVIAFDIAAIPRYFC